MYDEIYNDPVFKEFIKQHKVRAVLESKEYISVGAPAVVTKFYYIIHGFSEVRYRRLTFKLPDTEERLVVILPDGADPGLEVGRSYYVCPNPLDGATAANEEGDQFMYNPIMQAMFAHMDEIRASNPGGIYSPSKLFTIAADKAVAEIAEGVMEAMRGIRLDDCDKTS